MSKMKMWKFWKIPKKPGKILYCYQGNLYCLKAVHILFYTLLISHRYMHIHANIELFMIWERKKIIVKSPFNSRNNCYILSEEANKAVDAHISGAVQALKNSVIPQVWFWTLIPWPIGGQFFSSLFLNIIAAVVNFNFTLFLKA